MSTVVSIWRGAPAPAKAVARTALATLVAYPLIRFVQIPNAHPLETATSVLAMAVLFAHTHTVHAAAKKALGAATAVPVVALFWAACFTVGVAVDSRCLRAADTCNAADLSAAAASIAALPVAMLLLASPLLGSRLLWRRMRRASGRR